MQLLRNKSVAFCFKKEKSIIKNRVNFPLSLINRCWWRVSEQIVKCNNFSKTVKFTPKAAVFVYNPFTA
jgi:hypothetical protein